MGGPRKQPSQGWRELGTVLAQAVFGAGLSRPGSNYRLVGEADGWVEGKGSPISAGTVKLTKVRLCSKHSNGALKPALVAFPGRTGATPSPGFKGPRMSLILTGADIDTDIPRWIVTDSLDWPLTLLSPTARQDPPWLLLSRDI